MVNEMRAMLARFVRKCPAAEVGDNVGKTEIATSAFRGTIAALLSEIAPLATFSAAC